MNLLKVFSGVAAVAATLVSFAASADTWVPANCTWNVTQVVNIPVAPGGSLTISQCKDGSTLAATKVIGSGPNTTCSLTAATADYRVSGNCYSPYVEKRVPSPVCPQAGKVYPYYIQVGLGQPAFPTDAVNAFCTANTNPSCGFTTTVINSSATGATLSATCATK